MRKIKKLLPPILRSILGKWGQFYFIFALAGAIELAGAHRAPAFVAGSYFLCVFGGAGDFLVLSLVNMNFYAKINHFTSKSQLKMYSHTFFDTQKCSQINLLFSTFVFYIWFEN